MIGEWKNHYEINQIGLSNEIPVTKNTLTHVKLSMEEIRKSEFSISDKTVNGFVAIAMQLNSKIQEMPLDDVIALEIEEYENILKELDDLELLDDDGTISLDDENCFDCYEQLSEIYPNLVGCNDLNRLTGQILGVVAKLL